MVHFGAIFTVNKVYFGITVFVVSLETSMFEFLAFGVCNWKTTKLLDDYSVLQYVVFIGLIA